jgi:hypothetical protein
MEWERNARPLEASLTPNQRYTIMTKSKQFFEELVENNT